MFFPLQSEVNVIAAVTSLSQCQPNTVATRDVEVDPVAVPQLCMYITPVANLYRNKLLFVLITSKYTTMNIALNLSCLPVKRIATRDVKEKDIYL
jgi:hypothetical protein